MSKENYYKLLGIPVTASPDEIKAAYRKLARKYHPDLNPNDKNANKKFQAINEANQVLSDPKKREAYDQYGAEWKNAPEEEPPLRKKAKKESKPQGETYKAYYDHDYGNIKIKIRMTDAYLFTSFTIDF